jgi:integrase
VDLAAGRLRVRDSKTDAGVRDLELLPALRDELAAHKASAAFARDEDLVFPNATGRAQGASNVRRRVLARAVERANERRADAGLAPVPEGLTPHALRRTFASVLFALGRELPYVMAQLGHSDPKMTLGVYAKVMLGGEEERGALRALVGSVGAEPEAAVASVAR